MFFLAIAAALTVNAQTPQQPAPATPPVAQSAPSLDDIVARHIDAVGGSAAIIQIKSVKMDTSMLVMGTDAPGTITILNGVGFKQETNFNGVAIVQCFNLKDGWQWNPLAGAAAPTPMSDEEYKNGKDSILVGGPLYDYAARGSKLELVAGSADAYAINITNKDGVTSTVTLDPKTYLMKSLVRKSQLQGQDVTMTVNYSDYRKTATGYLMPYRLDLDFGGQFQMNIVVKNIELNTPVDPSIFNLPKAAAAPAAAQ
jgi:hypothetical protein